jgi:hypothetical protein
MLIMSLDLRQSRRLPIRFGLKLAIKKTETETELTFCYTSFLLNFTLPIKNTLQSDVVSNCIYRLQFKFSLLPYKFYIDIASGI